MDPRREEAQARARVCAMPVMIEAGWAQGMGYSNTYVGGYAEPDASCRAVLLEVPMDCRPSMPGCPSAGRRCTCVEKGALGREAPLVVGWRPVGLR